MASLAGQMKPTGPQLAARRHQASTASTSRSAPAAPSCRPAVAARGTWREVEPSYPSAWIQANGMPNEPVVMSPEDMQADPMGTLFNKRVIFLGGEVEDFGADALVSQLFMLDTQDPGKDIVMMINSPGGSVTAGLGVYDTMHLIRSEVSTKCFGLAASMGAFLLGAGRKGKRYALPNARIMIHQPLGGAGGQAVDMELQAKEIMYHKSNLNRIIANYTGQPLSKVEQDTDRDNYMNPIQAREYGIIDHVVGGDDKVFDVKGSIRKFPKLREEFIHDKNDLVGRNIMDGDPFLGGNPSWRFKSSETEPYVPSQSPGSKWFKVRKVSKEQYKEMLERNKAAAAGSDKAPRSPKEKIDANWMED